MGDIINFSCGIKLLRNVFLDSFIDFSISCGLSLIEHKVHTSSNTYYFGIELMIARKIYKRNGYLGFYRGFTVFTYEYEESSIENIYSQFISNERFLKSFLLGYCGVQLYKMLSLYIIDFPTFQNPQLILIKTSVQSLIVCPLNCLSSKYINLLVGSTYFGYPLRSQDRIFQLIFNRHNIIEFYRGVFIVFIQLLLKNTFSNYT